MWAGPSIQRAKAMTLDLNSHLEHCASLIYAL